MRQHRNSGTSQQVSQRRHYSLPLLEQHHHHHDHGNDWQRPLLRVRFLLLLLLLFLVVLCTHFLTLHSSSAAGLPPEIASLAAVSTTAAAAAGTKSRRFGFLVGAAKNVHQKVDHVSDDLLRVAHEIFPGGNYHIVISEEGTSHNWMGHNSTEQQAQKLTILRTEKNPGMDRISRLAYARNQYLEFVQQEHAGIIPKDMTIEDCVMIVFDMDFTCEIEWTSIGTALEPPLMEQWDAVSFNIANYWDWYAFEDVQKRGSYDKTAHTQFLEELNALREDQLLEVISAFAIAGVYKLSHLIDTRYVYEQGECEHKGLHKMMKEKHNSRIMVSPMPLYRFGCM